jgi:hypothetical protein
MICQIAGTFQCCLIVQFTRHLTLVSTKLVTSVAVGSSVVQVLVFCIPVMLFFKSDSDVLDLTSVHLKKTT